MVPRASSLATNAAAPIASAGADQVVSVAGQAPSATVTLDGSASFDPDGTIVSYQWLENGAAIATGPTASLSLGLGTHTITLRVTDDDQATGEDQVVVEVGAVRRGDPNGVLAAAGGTAALPSRGPAPPRARAREVRMATLDQRDRDLLDTERHQDEGRAEEYSVWAFGEKRAESGHGDACEDDDRSLKRVDDTKQHGGKAGHKQSTRPHVWCVHKILLVIARCSIIAVTCPALLENRVG